jgi:hypothetical protein
MPKFDGKGKEKSWGTRLRNMLLFDFLLYNKGMTWQLCLCAYAGQGVRDTTTDISRLRALYYIDIRFMLYGEEPF